MQNNLCALMICDKLLSSFGCNKFSNCVKPIVHQHINHKSAADYLQRAFEMIIIVEVRYI